MARTKSNSSSRSRASKNSKTSGRSGRSTGQRNGRSASQKPEKYRFAQNVDGEQTAAEREYRNYARDEGEAAAKDPDVLIDIPVVKVDSIHLELEDLAAHVALKAQVLDLVNLNVGVDAELGKVKLDIKGVEAQALLKVRLDHVAAIVDRVLTTVDRHPDLVESLGRTIEHVGEGAEQTLGEAGEAVEEIGGGAGQAVGEIGQGAGQAVEDVGQGAGQAAGSLDQLVAQLSQAVGKAGQAAGGGGGSPIDPGAIGDLVKPDHGTRAKTAAKLTVKELGSAASEKVKEIGQRRKRRRADKHDATERAYDLADELGVDLDDIEGTGTDGRITVKDVREAAAG